jgi:hypothetical protein
MSDKITQESIEDLLKSYEPNSVEELAEWLLMAARNLKGPDGKRILSPLEPPHAYQIALMMYVAKLKVQW